METFVAEGWLSKTVELKSADLKKHGPWLHVRNDDFCCAMYNSRTGKQFVRTAAEGAQSCLVMSAKSSIDILPSIILEAKWGWIYHAIDGSYLPDLPLFCPCQPRKKGAQPKYSHLVVCQEFILFDVIIIAQRIITQITVKPCLHEAGIVDKEHPQKVFLNYYFNTISVNIWLKSQLSLGIQICMSVMEICKPLANPDVDT